MNHLFSFIQELQEFRSYSIAYSFGRSSYKGNKQLCINYNVNFLYCNIDFLFCVIFFNTPPQVGVYVYDTQLAE